MKNSNNASFSAFNLKNGTMWQDVHSLYPTRLHGLVGSNTVNTKEGSTYFIFVEKGVVWIDGTWPIIAGMYAAIVKGTLQGNDCARAIIIERIGYKAQFSIGGPIEAKGRLCYIDGCTDSLLIAPVKKGDACLNHLHFPTNINQTMHVHPSVRIGMVAKGKGLCLTPFGNVELTEGMVFVIHPDSGEFAEATDGKMYAVGSHCFQTSENTMDVVAFHPDSDFGPTDENHPMLNMTMVGGVSASKIEAIRTK